MTGRRRGWLVLLLAVVALTTALPAAAASPARASAHPPAIIQTGSGATGLFREHSERSERPRPTGRRKRRFRLLAALWRLAWG